MDDGQRNELKHWLLPQLEQAWDDELSGSSQVLGERYVQWSGFGIGLQIECSSNLVLTGNHRLASYEVARLRDLGWHSPAGEDLPNHWRVFFDREELADAADALVEAVDLLRVPPAGVPVPTPTPTDRLEPAAEQPGRWAVVVPVVRVADDRVALVRDSVVEAVGNCVLIDYARQGTASELPVHPFDKIVRGPSPLSAAVTVDIDYAVQTWEAGVAARTLGQALERTRRLLRRGLDVVLVLPALPYELRWLYGSLLADADVVVFVLHEVEDSHMSWLALEAVVAPLVDGPVLLGAAAALEGSVLRALGGLSAVVDERDDDVRSRALRTLVRGVWEPDVTVPWDQVALREAVFRARLAPLAARMDRLPRRLVCAHDAEAALALLSDLRDVVEEHLEHLQDVGFAALGRVRHLARLLEEAGRRGVPEVGYAAATLSWLAECGAAGAEAMRESAIVVGSQSPAKAPPPASPLSELLDDLAPDPAVRAVVEKLATEQAVLPDRRANYISLRPNSGGAVAVYVHRSVLSLALPTELAPQVAVALPNAALEQGSAVTTYLRVPASSASEQPQVVLTACAQALLWRANRPGSLP